MGQPIQPYVSEGSVVVPDEDFVRAGDFVPDECLVPDDAIMPPAVPTDRVHATKVAEAIQHADRLRLLIDPILAGVQDARAKLRCVLDAVLADEKIKTNFVGSDIRYKTMCGEVAREILGAIGEDPDLVGLLAIGDVILPEFAVPTIRAILDSAYRFHMQLVDEENCGYDLSSRGSLSARQALIGYFDESYGFSGVEGLPDHLSKNCAIASGGMRGLDDLASAHVRLASLDNNHKMHPRFIQPDNSFSTWHSIVKLRSADGVIADVHTLPTLPENRLHLAVEDVDAFYAVHLTKAYGQVRDALPYSDMWCVTPVGNPSGTKMTPEQLAGVCERIVAHAPTATILLDCTYIRTLPVEQARALTAVVVHNPTVLNRVMFLESFSKTHGICGERIGAYFSANTSLFDEHHALNMMLSAGNGRGKSGLALALANTTSDQEAVIRDLHRFWHRERLGLYHYLLGSERFGHLFDKKQLHLQPDQLSDPLGLYLLPKIHPDISGESDTEITKKVLIDTGCLGVVQHMGHDGTDVYIRLAVGKLTEPTYAKYIPASSDAVGGADVDDVPVGVPDDNDSRVQW